MAVWRYRAVPLSDAVAAARQGELAATTAAEARASLRRVGLQVLDIRQVTRIKGAARNESAVLSTLWNRILRLIRQRRRAKTSELYDGLATMLESGLPLLEALITLSHTRGSNRSRENTMLIDLCDQVRSGSSLADAIERHPGWFDAVEVAMVSAGQQRGDLAGVLRRLADRHERANELSQKLVGALAYPSIVAAVGVAVVIFLSVKTLPDLVSILATSGLETPALTQAVIVAGHLLAEWWWLLAVALIVAFALIPLMRAIASRLGLSFFHQLKSRLLPRVFRRLAVAQVASQLAELTRVGIPVVEAIRVLTPAAPASIRGTLASAAVAVEEGRELSDALNEERFFDAEFRRLIEVGQSSGELDQLLERIAGRYTRQARRLIDRLTTLLEPAVIIALAFLIGLVVMAAILPLVRLQEVLR